MKSLESSDKQLPSIKGKERVDFELLMKQKELKKKKKRFIKVKWFTEDIIKPIILENLKQYMPLMKLEIILLICVQKMNKTI